MIRFMFKKRKKDEDLESKQNVGVFVDQEEDLHKYRELVSRLICILIKSQSMISIPRRFGFML